MLSVGRREDGRERLGFVGVGMEEENELEEGEAWSGQEDDSCVDPDALSYIDEKIQDVLGHFQKDFEAGVSAENLGAKFGGYGSFLPTYQRSPSIFCQPRSPQKVPNQNVTRTPCNHSVEVTNQNPSVTMSSSLSKNNIVVVPPLENSFKRDAYTNKPNVQESNSQHSFNKTTNGTNHKSLKVRIKVGPDNHLARDNAAIYSGLGLVISPSSSFEDSPDGSGGISPEFQDLPDESPSTIIQIMTTFAVPGGLLLSPLQGSLFHLMENNSSIIKQCKKGMPYKGMPERSTEFADSTILLEEVKGQMERFTKSSEQKPRPREINSGGRADVIMNRETDIERKSGQELHSNYLNMPLSSIPKSVEKKAEKRIVGNTIKNDNKMLDHLREMKKASLQDRPTFPGSPKDKHFELVENTTSNGAGNSANEIMVSNWKLNPKASIEEKQLRERMANNQKGEKSDLQGEGRRLDKDYDITNAHSSGLKRRNELIAEPSDHVKPSSSPYKEKISQGKDQISDGKKKLKISKTNSESFGEYSKVNISGNSSAMLKEKKKISHAKAGRAEKKSKVLKPHKDSNGAWIKESHGSAYCDFKDEQLENGVDPLEFQSKGKHKFTKAKYEKELTVSTQTFKEKSGVKKVDNIPISGALCSEPILAPLTCNAPATGATVAPQAPVVIEEHWVCCDICQKWRLLPYGTNPGHLPKKWQCNLLNWLPGMNSCDISEEETTNALHALYLAPAPGNGASLDSHHDVVASCISSANGIYVGQNLELNNQNVPTIGKKKSSQKYASNIPSHSTPTQLSNSVKKDQQASLKCRSSNDANQCHPFELNSSNKGALGNVSRSSDFNTEKQKLKHKDKHKNHGSYSDGGEHSGKIEKHAKSKSKREVDQDDLRVPKKFKKNILQYPKSDCSNQDETAKAFEETDTGGYFNKVRANNKTRWNKFSLSKDSKCDLKGHSSSSKKWRDEDQFITDGESKEHFSASDVEKSSKMDLSAKNRKEKEWQGSQHNQEVFVTSQHVVENEVIVDKKVELSGSVGKGSKTTKLNSKMDKKVNMTRMILPASGEHNEVLRVVEKEHQSKQSQGNIASLRELDFESLKRDMTYAQPPVAANSSSSKVSGSRKSRSNLQETKGSPVESVSSSPLRIPNIKKLSCKRISERKDDATNAASSVLWSPKRCSDSELDGRIGHSGKGRKEVTFSIQQRSLESHRPGDCGILDSFGGTCDYLEKDTNELSVGKSEKRLHVKRSPHDDFLPIELVEHSYKDDIQDTGKVNKHHLVNSSSQRKTFKSSSGFKEKHRSSKSDLDKSKLRTSGSYSENKDLHSTKNGSSCRLEASFGSREHSTCPDALRNEKGNFQEKDEKDCLKKDPTSKWMTGRRDNSSTSVVKEKLDSNVAFMLSNQRRESDSKIPVVGTRSVKREFQVAPSIQNEKASRNPCSDGIDCRPCSDGIDCPELLSGLGKSQSKLNSVDRQETQSHRPHMGSSPLKVSRSDVDVADALNGDPSKIAKQCRQTDMLNGLHLNNLRHATSNGPDTSSPIRKENHSALVKEARDLKHTANRLKNEGLELESTGLYFEAALKFLHVAALMEALNSDSAKQAEAALMYSETAKLCVFVAREYEKVKDIAAASLAHKCIEVAHLKAAYCKNPNASKDRHELQAALQFLPPGESPSSSASDLDNLNNQAIFGKNASTKGGGSPQVAGNHVIASRHHHQVMRLLHYTNDIICAFDATRKAQNALAAASVSLEKDRVDCIRKVLDFNFHNVEGLLRLVRLSLESIGR